MASTIETKYTNQCQIRMKWKIKEDEVVKCIEGHFLQSDAFSSSIPGVKYHLRFNPNDERKNEVYIYLHLSYEMTKKISATFTVFIKSASIKHEYIDQIYEKSTSWGRKLCNSDELFKPQKKYFIDEIMEIELEGTLKPLGIKRKAPESFSLLEYLWENDEDKNITIVAEDQELKVHKWILAGNSSVFKAELESGLKESKENKIEIADFCFKTLKTAIEFCYQRDVKDQITEENASELLHFAEKYNMQSFLDVIQTSLIEQLSETNVCKFANASITSNAKDLREYCICFLMKFIRKPVLICGIQNLDDAIHSEISRRSFFSTSE